MTIDQQASTQMSLFPICSLLQSAVVSSFKHAWSAYRKYAWGKDELKPMTRNHAEWFNCGLTLLDALDTMYIMGLKTEFDEAKEWVRNNNLVSGKDVNLFEFTIRFDDISCGRLVHTSLI